LTLNVLAYAAFVPTGLITVLLGPLLPTLEAHWNLNDTQAGYLVTAQFLGSLLATVSSGWLLARIRFRWSLVLGLALMGIGAATLLARDYAWGLGAVFAYGMGTGVTVPTTNLLIARAAHARSSASLNVLNFFWSAGAVACPVLLAVFLPSGHVTPFLLGVAGFFGLLIVALLTLPLEMLDLGPDSASPRSLSLLAVLRSPIAAVLGALFFVYVGTESAFGAWLASYAKRIATMGSEAWITVPSYFYGALLLGRIVSPLTLQRLSDLRQARWGSGLAVVGAAALLASHSLPAVIVSSLLIGFGFSSLYPIAIGFLASSLGSDAPRIASVLFALSTLGGAVIPWTVGYVSTESGALRLALLVPFIGCCTIAALFWVPQYPNPQYDG
jgi:fucose permease